MSSENFAIPTLYNGVQYRSRLEAKWATMFDLLGWDFEYEAIDLDGYIPDFILKFNEPILAEIKPAFTLAEMMEHTHKIDASGWDKEAVIFGATFNLKGEDDCFVYCGLYKQFDPYMGQYWAPAIFHKCFKCGQYSFHHSQWRWDCAVNGCYDGDSFLDFQTVETAKALWAEATNTVQYNRKP